jgi:hypothetical protein
MVSMPSPRSAPLGKAEATRSLRHPSHGKTARESSDCLRLQRTRAGFSSIWDGFARPSDGAAAGDETAVGGPGICSSVRGLSDRSVRLGASGRSAVAPRSESFAGSIPAAHSNFVHSSGAGEASAPAYRLFLPTSRQVSTSPLPFTAMRPSGSVTNSSSSSSQVGRVIWISSEIPCDSMRLAMFTVSPHRS